MTGGGRGDREWRVQKYRIVTQYVDFALRSWASDGIQIPPNYGTVGRLFDLSEPHLYNGYNNRLSLTISEFLKLLNKVMQ